MFNRYCLDENDALYRSWRAYDADGNDVSDNFDIVFVGTGLTVKPLEITVVTGSAEAEYTGEPLECTAVTVTAGADTANGLADGDEIVVVEYTSVIDVGEEENVLVVAIMRNGVDVTSNYKINYVYGTLTIYD